MHLIIGGAYQGKLDCAKKRFMVRDEEIFTCSEESGIVFGARCINCLEEFTLWCVKNKADAAEIFRAHRKEWENSILICEDIFCGVVPLGADMRAWREATGRLCAYLSSEAESVTRMFCGLEQKLK
ncbi:MAG: bifunctional adenosylcobinamide kinase/adenosylcobinamide-phosphate guanylyltransferase [Clostridia bacterium]|nr:bifunctional adenosylcobinamide kinase/adenosylcobinamide-phosphate guanylyltransferase [Clostridia bacterium]